MPFVSYFHVYRRMLTFQLADGNAMAASFHKKHIFSPTEANKTGSHFVLCERERAGMAIGGGFFVGIPINFNMSNRICWDAMKPSEMRSSNKSQRTDYVQMRQGKRTGSICGRPKTTK